MKKYIILFSAALLLLLGSCRDAINAVLDALPPFNAPFTTTLTVPFAGVSTTAYTRTPEIPMNIDLDAQIRQNNPNYSVNNLKSVRLSKLNLEFVESDLGNQLDVIRNAKIYVKAPNLPEKLIATVTDNTSPTNIEFTVADVELLEYFRTSQNSLILEIQASRPAADRLTVKLQSGFKVKVQL